MARRNPLVLVVAAAALITATVTIASLAWVQVSQQRAERREAALGHVLTAVNARSRAADIHFLRLQGLLEGLAEAAEQALTHDPGFAQQALFFDVDYGTPDTAPPDLVHATRYRAEVSFGWPVFKLAPGVTPDHVRQPLEQLVLLRHTFRTLFLRSYAEEAVNLDASQAAAVLGEEGAPILWSYVATIDGIHTAYPGHTGYPDDYDPRRRPWYLLGRSGLGPQWGSPYIDVNGLGLLLPCAMSLWSNDGTFLGVAGLELTFDFVIDEVLRIPALPGVRDSYLVDGSGNVLISTGMRGVEVAGGLHDNRALALEPLPLPEVVAAVAAGRSGHVELGDDLVIYSRLESLGWSLVAVGPTAGLLPVRN